MVKQFSQSSGLVGLADYILLHCIYYGGGWDDDPRRIGLRKANAMCDATFVSRFRYWRKRQYNIDFTDRDLK